MCFMMHGEETRKVFGYFRMGEGISKETGLCQGHSLRTLRRKLGIGKRR